MLGIFCLAKNSEAKDLYVSTMGNDSVTYANNDIDHPWATVERVWGYNSGEPNYINNYPSSELPKAGDVVYFRAGTYAVNRTVGTRYAGNDGTENAPITFRNYNDKQVTISGHGNDVGNSLIVVEYDYYHFLGLNFSGSGFGAEGAIIRFGNNRSGHGAGGKIENCHFTITSSNSTDNVAAVTMSPPATGTTIKNSNFFGQGTCSGVHIWRTKGAKVENNEFQNWGNGIYLKHSNSLEDTGVSFANNFIHSCSMGIRTNSNYAKIENNLIINAAIKLGDDGGMGDGYTGADFNVIRHNTIYGDQIDLTYEGRPEDPMKGCLHNTITDNILMKRSEWHAYSYSYPSGSDLTYSSDYNLYPSGDILLERGVAYTLESWKAHNGTDMNSLSGSPDFVGGTGIQSYALTTNTLGYQAGSDGKDMGADVSLVGQNVGQQTDATLPNAPNGLSVS